MGGRRLIRKLIQEYLRVVKEYIKAASRVRDMGLRYIHKVESQHW